MAKHYNSPPSTRHVKTGPNYWGVFNRIFTPDRLLRIAACALVVFAVSNCDSPLWANVKKLDPNLRAFAAQYLPVLASYACIAWALPNSFESHALAIASALLMGHSIHPLNLAILGLAILLTRSSVPILRLAALAAIAILSITGQLLERWLHLPDIPLRDCLNSTSA